MPTYRLTVTVTAEVEETWLAEGESPQAAFEAVLEGNGDCIADCVLGEERDRELDRWEIATAEPEPACPNLAPHAPAMLAALRKIAAYESERPHGAELDGVSAAQMAGIAEAALAAIDGTPTAQPAGAIGEAGDRCASCGAEEGESHGAQCEARGFAMGADARRLDTGALRSVTGDDADWLEATASRDGGEC